MVRTGQRFKNDILYGLVRVGLAWLGVLPRRLLMALGPALGWVAHLVALPERSRARDNIARSMLRGGPHAERALVRAVFRHLGQSLVECVALRRRAAFLEAQVAFVDGAELRLREAYRQGRGVVLVTAHLGNWELMGALIARLGRLCVLARSSYDPRLTQLIAAFRRANHLETIWVDHPGALRRACSVLLKGAILGILVDQRPRQGGCEIEFLGRTARMSTLAAALSRRTGATLMCGYAFRQSNGLHRVAIEPVASDPVAMIDPVAIPSSVSGRAVQLRSVTTTIAHLIEQAILRAPEQWLWTLDRWG